MLSVNLPAGPGSPPVPAVCLVILDGWGLAPDGPGNAVSLASTPVFDSLWESYAHTQLTASGRAVGLPEGQMGNSEVGHLNLGAGAVVRQDLTRIDDAVEDGSFFDNPVLREICDAGSASGRLHLLGLVSKGGVHSGWEHLRACIELAGRAGVPDIVLHAFTDGRDTAPDSGASSPDTIRNSVDLPTPLGATTPRRSPPTTTRSTSTSTLRAPKPAVTPRSVTVPDTLPVSRPAKPSV